MDDPAAITGAVFGAVSATILLVAALWIPLVGWAPRWALRWEARLIRCAKGASGRPGAKRSWNSSTPRRAPRSCSPPCAPPRSSTR